MIYLLSWKGYAIHKLQKTIIWWIVKYFQCQIGSTFCWWEAGKWLIQCFIQKQGGIKRKVNNRAIKINIEDHWAGLPILRINSKIKLGDKLKTLEQSKILGDL